MSSRIIVFAKAPLPHQAKTRLIPALGAVGAADFAKHLLMASLNKALAADIGPVELCLTLPDHKVWQQLTIPDNVIITEQQRGDLGYRMACAARPHLERGQAVLLMGTDCPDLNIAHLRLAKERLMAYDCVLTPVVDGGYCLIAMNAFHRRLFSDMPWSTAAVAAITRQRCAELNWRCYSMESLRDVDTPDDLKYCKIEK